MKTKAILLAAILFVAFGGKSFAQDECHTLGSLFTEPAKAGNYQGALQHYKPLVDKCPSWSMATYQYGAKMFEDFIEKGDKSKITDLEQNLAMRMKYYAAKTQMGREMANIAQVKYDASIGTKKEQFDAFDAAFKKDEESFTSPKSLYTYFSLAVDLEEEGVMDVQDVFNLYDTIIDKLEREEIDLSGKLMKLVDKEDAGTTLTSKEKKYLGNYETNLSAYGKVKGSVNGKLGNLANCENLIPLYEKLFEENKNDVNWLKSAATKLNDKECETPLFGQLVQQWYTLEPSASVAFFLGKLAEEKGNMKEATDYYNQAAELNPKPKDKAKAYFSLGETNRKKGSLSTARNYYNKALEENPSLGIAYLRIAKMYADSANNCGTTAFEKRAIYWKAAEMADRAARVDGSIAGTANATASSYRGYAPSKTEIFSASMAGKTITFSCWVGGSVKVPNL
ncbi:tetratricopeptide repeat protein [Rasiella sp. SM2506]|uniref:tetratricopeptide repeat protein n=1 Tax=Rasiella sp. SM2506 TaxID=3423914 RepID=UPI003D79A7CC